MGFIKKNLGIPPGSAPYHTYWWLLFLHSYLATILGMDSILKFNLLNTILQIKYLSMPLILDSLVYRVVNETLETISLDLGFGGSTMAEGIF